MSSASPLQRLALEVCDGRAAVRAVIVRAWGSTPREVGADMVVDESGELYGTVGGGCGEAEVYEAALELLHSKSERACLFHVDLTENPEDGGGKVCGGRFDLLLARYDPTSDRGFARELQLRLESNEPLTLRTEVGGGSPGFWKLGHSRVQVDSRSSLVADAASEPRWVEGERADRGQFIEPIGQVEQLIVVGAGHIARPLCAMASIAGYRVTVLDDRAEYARPAFFPEAHRVVCGEYSDVLGRLEEPEQVSVVLVTRGHKHDQDCLRLLVGTPLRYLGMIGSQRRIDAVYAELVEEGFSIEELRKVAAPIGLEIGAQTPAEIACSILAQMIARRRLDPDFGRTGSDRRRYTRVLRS